MRRLDLIIAAVLLATFAVAAWQAKSYGLLDEAVPQPGMFVMFAAVVGMLAATYVLVLRLRSKPVSLSTERPRLPDDTPERDPDTRDKRALAWAMIATLVPSVLTASIGLIASLVVMSAVLARLAMHASLTTTISVSLMVPLFAYVVFGIILGVQIPAGQLGLL